MGGADAGSNGVGSKAQLPRKFPPWLPKCLEGLHSNPKFHPKAAAAAAAADAAAAEAKQKLPTAPSRAEATGIEISLGPSEQREKIPADNFQAQIPERIEPRTKTRSTSIATSPRKGEEVDGAGALAQVLGADSGLRAITFEPLPKGKVGPRS